MWQKHKRLQNIRRISLTAWRAVNTFATNTTRRLVDSSEEQAILDEMIDAAKIPQSTDHQLYHHLLAAPFALPPLQYHSRFGKAQDTGVWYGSELLTTAFAEKAYYQLRFLRASQFETDRLETQISAFTAAVNTPTGVDLTKSPFDQHTKQISSPMTYVDSQSLGAILRENQIQCALFQSARDPQQGKNIAVFDIAAFSQKKPIAEPQIWQCIVQNEIVEFTRGTLAGNVLHRFSIDDFLVNDTLPEP